MKHVFVFDPKSFHGQQWRMDGLIDTIGQHFRTQERPNFSILFSHYPRDAIGLIQKQIDEAEEDEVVRVYAIGGDDILFDCLNGIAGLPNMELAVAPYGNTNSFIRSFGDGKAEVFKDISSLATAETVSTDMIAVGNNCAINGCSVGLIPAVAMKMKELEEKFEKGLNRFSIGFWASLFNLTSLFNKDIIAHRYTITVDDNDYSGNYSLINIVNAPYYGRNKAALAGALLADGLLDVLLFKSAAPLSTSASLKKYSRGKKKLPSNCVRVQAKKIDIKSDKPMWIQTDSEFLLDTNITFEVIPGAVQVVAVNNLVYQGS